MKLSWNGTARAWLPLELTGTRELRLVETLKTNGTF